MSQLRTRTAATLAALVVALSALSWAAAAPVSAHAGEVETSFGRAEFVDRDAPASARHIFRVCDTARDGKRVVGYVSYFDAGRQNIAVDRNGAGNACSRPVEVVAERAVFMTLCSWDRSSGEDLVCAKSERVPL